MAYALMLNFNKQFNILNYNYNIIKVLIYGVLNIYYKSKYIKTGLG